MRMLPLLLLASGCTGSLELTVGNVGLSGDGIGSYVSVSQRGDRHLDIQVSTRAGEGTWVPVDTLEIEEDGHKEIDVVLVADNSGSTAQWEESIAEAVEHFGQVVLASSHTDRVGLVRVSTEAALVQDLTHDQEAIEAAAQTLFVNRGWTALWDGVRLANEVLQAGSVDDRGAASCVDRAYRGIVVFTDGADNNSRDEQASSYSGDGVDTRFEDLLDLRIHDVRTAVHTVSVGDAAEEDLLETLALETGGSARSIRTYGGLMGALNGAANQLDGQVPLCFVPSDCAHDQARVEVTDGQTTVGYVTPIPTTCD